MMKRSLIISATLLLMALIMLISQGSVAEVTNSGVAFRETGLPNGTLWAVNCNGQQYQSTNPDIAITLSPGTYTYYVPDISGYAVLPQNGTVTAILDPIKLTDITFSPISPSPTPTASLSPTPIPSASPLSSSPSSTPTLTPSASIPEFPTGIILPLLAIMLLLTVFIRKRMPKLDKFRL
jgi:hypothetical protein